MLVVTEAPSCTKMANKSFEKDHDKFGTSLTKPTTVEEMELILNRVKEMVINFAYIIIWRNNKLVFLGKSGSID